MDLVRAYPRSPASKRKGIPGAMEPFLEFERLPVELLATEEVYKGCSAVIEALWELSSEAVEPGRPEFDTKEKTAHYAISAVQKAIRADLKIKE